MPFANKSAYSGEYVEGFLDTQGTSFNNRDSTLSNGEVFAKGINGHQDMKETMNGHHIGAANNLDCHLDGETQADPESNSQVPIAICGMALRLPAGLSTSQQLWDFLLAKGDARCKVPNSRYNVSAFYDPTGKPGTVKTEHGYFLAEDISHLDTSFFSMARMEVERLDPQQRLMLEVARECLEDAGVTNWRGKSIGCYVGSLGEDWCEMFARETQNWGNYRITGYGDFALSNRISYELDLQGPSMTIRTACSASLVALHEACVAISRGDCESAIIGGANLIMTPGCTMSMTEQNVLSPDGSCKTFSAEANGYARGEAITALYIKKWDDAVKDRDPIRAVIKGTATNHDGKTPRLTVPSSDAQEALIRRAYQVAGIKDFSRTAFVECHGTGTKIGDPVEATAVGRIFGEKGVHIGSIKPNFGHTEGASGVLSVMKSVLALQNRTIPPNIKFKNPNPAIPFESANLVVPTDPTPWPNDRAERVSVNSFGIGGTNAHVIIDSAASSNASIPFRATVDEPQLFLFSANSQRSLSRMVDNYRDFAETNPDYIGNLAYTLANRREHLAYRTFAIASKGNLGITEPAIRSGQSSSVIMVFTGQGAQWPQMGRDLLDSNSTFLNSIRCLDDCLHGMKAHAPKWKIEDELRKVGNKKRINSADLAQPLCAAIQIALVDVFASLGVRPSAVVGHSSGEIAAAYAAGALTAQEAIINAMFRGASTKTQEKSGSMAAIGMSWQETEKYLLENVTIACDNSPNSVTISGDCDETEAVIANIQKSEPNVLARKLQVDKAYHSYHMAEVGARYRSLIDKLMIQREPTTLFFSSVFGRLVQSTTLSSEYWQRNLESPVLFRSAITSILKNPIGKNAIFLEIGPHSALAGPLRQNLTHASSTAPYISAMHRNQNCVESLLSAVGRLHSRQVHVDLQTLIPKGSCLSDLPPYPWDHEENYWYESRLSKEYRQRKYPHHDLLGSRVQETTESEPAWRNMFHLDNAAWVRDHKVGDDVVFPFAGYVAMAGEAARQISGKDETFHIRHIVVNTALVVGDGKPTEIITTLRQDRLTDSLNSQWWEFTISSYNGHTWSKHCTGQVMAQKDGLGLSQMPQPFPRKVDVRKWFNILQQAGLDLGPAFRNLGDASADTLTQRATAKVLNKTEAEEQKYHIQPTAMDSTLQLVGIAFTHGEGRKHQNRLPVSCENIGVHRCRSIFTADATTKFTGGSVVGEIQGGADGVTVLKMSGLKLATVDNVNLIGTNDVNSTARQQWGPDIDFMDLKRLIKPSINHALYTPSLEELSLLCSLYTQRCRAERTQKLHLQKFNQWIDDRLSSQDLSSIQGYDNERLTLEIDSLVQNLAGTPARPAAIAIQKICDGIRAISSDDASSWEDLLPSKIISELYDYINPCDASLFIQRLAHCKPNLRVLEIGSWRSSPSDRILSNLTLSDGRSLWSKYTFTSKGFVSGQTDQKMAPNMEHITLDTSIDPFEQGFENRQFDLIIASNAIHLNRNICESLKNIKKLLDPTGHLVLQELCPSSKWVNYVFGTSQNWWCGLADRRHDEPYIDTRRWHDELEAADFGKPDAVVLDAEEPFQLNATMIVKPAPLPPPPKGICILSSDTVEDTDPILNALRSEGYDAVQCRLHDQPPPDRDVVALLDREKPFLENLDSDRFSSLKAFLANLNGSGIFWITRLSQMHCQDPRYAQIIGMARTMRSESLIDFATCEVDDIDGCATLIPQVFAKFQSRDMNGLLKPDFEYVIHDNKVNIGRFYPFAFSEELQFSEANDRVVLDLETPGRLSSLQWARKPALPSLQPDEVDVEIWSVGLNFRDVLVAMKIVEFPKFAIGLEAAGVVRRVGSQVRTLHVGDRVAVIDRGVFSTTIVTLEMLCIKIPDSLEFDEASTIFFPYATALYSLMTIGGMEKGQSVLIHSACGGVGLAAVQLAQMMEAEVYVTVGSEEKVAHIMQTFSIPRHRIFNSRDESFVEGVMCETQHSGVDLVLNSLSGELLHVSWRCVAPFGKLIEIGKRDLLGFGKLDMNPFLANRSYCCVDIDALRERPAILHRLQQSIVELYQEGRISALRPIKVFDAASTYDAFRYMQRGQHIGKICVSIRKSSEDTGLSTKILGRQRSLELHNSASYLLVGGLGGLGRAISIWMVEHGARHLTYLSRNAGVSPEDGLFVNELNSMGCHVQLVQGSVTKPEDVIKVIGGVSRPLKGILQMSMVLRDENFSKMTLEQWNAASSPKVQGTWNLHNASINAGLELDFFILFSSLSGTIGQPGQANYAGANTFLDAFAQYRNNLGLPASAIDIGAVRDVGYISENPGLIQSMAATGYKALKEQEVLDALSLAITPKEKKSLSYRESGSNYIDFDSFVLGLASAIPLNSAANRAVWRRDRRMAIYHNAGGGDADPSASKASLKSYINSAKADISILKSADAAALFANEIGKRLFALLMKPEDDLNTSLSLGDLGLDSLVGIELAAWWKQTFGFRISVLEMLGKGNLEALGQHAAEGLVKAIEAERGEVHCANGA